MSKLARGVFASVLVLVGCGDDGGTGGGATASSATVTATSDASNGSTQSGSSGSGMPMCEAFGVYGPPGTTFTLPAVDGEAIYYPDLPASFPEVDFSTLSRLYIPAGRYKALNLGNLPMREPGAPLIITNLGGQVAVGPNDPGAGYIWAMNGGANWILTGRYDPESGTGDEAFPGHRCSDFAGSRGRYGFFSDDAFAKGQYLHMGLAATDVSDIEIEYVEITRSGFAGIRLLNPRDGGQPERPMANVRVHDTYVHDVDGEGFYFGWTGAPPSNLMPGLRIYRNRIVRTGNEALQIQNLGDDSEVHNNVFAFASLHWRDNGLGAYQDNNSQIQTRSGAISIHENVFVGGSGTLLSFFSGPEAGDAGRNVTFRQNVFSDTKSLGGYLNGTASGDSTFRFEGNLFRGLDFTYDLLDPAATDPGVIFGVNGALMAPISFAGNRWEGSRKIVNGIDGGDGTAGNVTASGNVNGPLEPVRFVASGYPEGVPYTKLEAWAPVATLSPGQPGITYQVGDVVMFDAEMYRCKQVSTGEPPPDHPESWEKLPLPVDDLRIVPGSPYATLGIH